VVRLRHGGEQVRPGHEHRGDEHDPGEVDGERLLCAGEAGSDHRDDGVRGQPHDDGRQPKGDDRDGQGDGHRPAGAARLARGSIPGKDRHGRLRDRAGQQPQHEVHQPLGDQEGVELRPRPEHRGDDHVPAPGRGPCSRR
jgi:hypothetical protein